MRAYDFFDAVASRRFAAQYRFILEARHDRLIAGIEASIPDIGALIFAAAATSSPFRNLA